MQSELQAIQLDATQNVKQNWWSSLDDLIVVRYVVTCYRIRSHAKCVSNQNYSVSRCNLL